MLTCLSLPSSQTTHHQTRVLAQGTWERERERQRKERERPKGKSIHEIYIRRSDKTSNTSTEKCLEMYMCVQLIYLVGTGNTCVLPTETHQKTLWGNGELLTSGVCNNRSNVGKMASLYSHCTQTKHPLWSPKRPDHVDCLFFILSSVRSLHSQSMKHGNNVLYYTWEVLIHDTLCPPMGGIRRLMQPHYVRKGSSTLAM